MVIVDRGKPFFFLLKDTNKLFVGLTKDFKVLPVSSSTEQPVNQYRGRNVSAGSEHAHSRSITNLTFQSLSTNMLLGWRSVSL